MNSLFAIPTLTATGLYAVFYALAFVVGALLIFNEGLRRKWPILPWLIVINACALCAIIGSKLALLSWEDFIAIAHLQSLPYSTQKTYLGGVLGGVAGICLARRILVFRNSVLDAFALALPFALALGRVGCLLGGCCFGTPTNLPWAISYASGSIPYAAHLAGGSITASAVVSLPIHPTQVYEIIFCLALSFCLWKCRHYWKAPGSLFYSQVILYGLFRFLIEFFRHGGTTVLGLKYVQWGLLLVIALVAVFLFHKEKRWPRQPQLVLAPSNNPSRNSLCSAGLILVLWSGRNWFTPLEVAVLQSLQLALITVACLQMLQAFARIRWRWARQSCAAVSPLLLLFMMQDSTAPDTVKSDEVTLSIGGMTGQYEETCGPTHSYNVAGISVAQTHRYTERQKLTFGLRGYFGVDENGEKFSIRVFNPYVHYDSRYLGLGVGGHLGDFIFDGDTDEHIYPAARLRIGPYNKFFIEGQFANHFPGSFPSPLLKFGLGIALKNEGYFRMGLSDAGYYINPYLTTRSGLAWEPFIGLGGQGTYQFGLTLHYRMRH